MDDVFVKQARAQFLEFSTIWIQMIADMFPECHESQDCRIFLTSVVKNSDSKLTEQIDLWYENMQTPLNPKNTKYAKAIERITKAPAVLYHTLIYRDAHAMEMNHKSEIVNTVRLFDKYRDERMGEENRTKMWRLLEKITHSCYEAKACKLPTVPSRAEIQENIRSKKEKPIDDAPSMNKAFQTHINGMCKHLGVPMQLNNAEDAKIRAWMARWNEFSRGETEGEKNVNLCNQNDSRVLPILGKAFPELHLPSSVDENVWKNINQLNGFSAVSENIPTKMMGRIEDMASRLADDIVAGRTDFASVNLSDIGQQVLSGCSEDDMSKFATNIENILPALSTFQKQAK